MDSHSLTTDRGQPIYCLRLLNSNLNIHYLNLKRPQIQSAFWVLLFLIYLLPAFKCLGNGPLDLDNSTINTGCNDPIVGKGAVVDLINTNLGCVLCGNPGLENMVDGDLSNFMAFGTLGSLVGLTPLVSIKDTWQDYPANTRVGFVVEAGNTFLSADLLENFTIQTYLDDTFQESASTGGGNLLFLSNVGGGGSKKRISFVSTLPFDEVELVVSSAVSGLSILNVYHAYTEPAMGCDYDCVSALVPPNYSSSINSTNTFITNCSIILGCGVEDTTNIVNSDTTDFGVIDFGLLGLNETGFVSVFAGTTLPAGYEVGFAIELAGFPGILNTSVLNNIQLTTRNGGGFQESQSATDAFSNVGQLGQSDITLVSFKTTLPFDEVQLAITELINAGAEYNIYYAFIRPDSDNDGVVDCVDNCAGGDDNFDTDGNGLPDDCDVVCNVNAGINITVCPPATTASLAPAGVGQVWIAQAGNPAPATVDNNGNVSGMTVDGLYFFELQEGLCSDVVVIRRQESAIDAACNDPVAGNRVIIDEFNLAGGICLNCFQGDAGNVIDGDLSNYSQYDQLGGVLSSSTLISVRDTANIYPAGYRAGYVISLPDALLDAQVLGLFELRTHLGGVLQETATSNNGALSAGAFGGEGNKQRLTFITTLPFDEIELVIGNTLGLLNSIRIYYAFEEPASCPSGEAATSCLDYLTANGDLCGMISYERTNILGFSCSACELDNIGNLVDADIDNFASINLTAGAAATATLSIKTATEIPAGYTAGFGLGGGIDLLTANVLQDLSVITYNNGVEQESITANNSLVDISLFSGSNGVGLLSFRTSLPFDEVQLAVSAPVTSNLLSSLEVYYAFVRGDIDDDGTPDCIDKCCGGDDNLDADGDGSPNDCDAGPLAISDMAMVDEGNMVVIDVLINDDFGNNGPGSGAVEIMNPPANGQVTVNDNGTPNDPTDDTVEYTPNPGFIGNDVATYQICDANGDCTQATINLTVNPLFVRLELRVLLQGALLETGGGIMRDDLRVNDLIPTVEPYTAIAGFNHIGSGGGETVADPLLVFADNGNNSVVDWVFVELRDPNDDTAVVTTRAGLVQRDGDVVDIDGVSALFFNQSVAGSYYVAVRHRNHLGTMTKTAIPLSVTGTVVDFTDPATDLWEQSPAFDGKEQKAINGTFALWAGNANTNGSVIFAGQNNDVDPIFNEIDQAPGNALKLQTYIYSGYHFGDVNVGGSSIFAGQNNDVDPIFNNVDGHPNNILKIQTFIIPEQLAK